VEHNDHPRRRNDLRRNLKSQPGKSIVKHGNGVLDAPLTEAGLIDELPTGPRALQKWSGDPALYANQGRVD
jgi:hypothetical protein